MRTPTPDEFEDGFELTSRVIGQPLPAIVDGVDAEQLAEPQGGPGDVERQVSCMELLAKFPPADLGRFIQLLDDPSARARQARSRLRKQFKRTAKQFGVRTVSNVI